MVSIRIVLGAVAAVAVLSGSVWVGRYAPWAEKPQTQRELTLVRKQREFNEMEDLRLGRTPKDSVGIATAPAVDPRPPLAETAPFPKAAILERVYRFGTMEVGEEKTHKFRIENRGEGPLSIGRGPTQCKCTLSRLANGSIAPGGFAEVDVSWTPIEFEEAFSKMAKIYTSDPETPEIDFAVIGRIVPKVEARPLTWNLGEISEKETSKVVGKIGSPLNAKFSVATLGVTGPNVKITYKPLTKEELAAAHWSAGCEFTATVGKDLPWGRFKSKARIRASNDPEHPVDVDINAVRTGDLHFLPVMPLVGTGIWSSNRTLLNLGVFGHERGSKVVMPALVSSMKGNFQLLGVDSEVGFLKISAQPDPSIGDSERQGVRFLIEVPPGSPALSRPSFAPVHVTLRTNHPTLSKIGFDIAFVSE